MTDYLEELLEEQIEQEETESELGFPQETGRLWKKRAETTGADGTEDDQPELPPEEQTGETVGYPAERNEWPGAYFVRVGAAMPGDRASAAAASQARGEQADAVKKESGQDAEEIASIMGRGETVLYERLRQSYGASAYGQRLTGGRQTTAPDRERVGSSSHFGVTDLDRIFQRDARRYDGAFLLY